MNHKFYLILLPILFAFNACGQSNEHHNELTQKEPTIEQNNTITNSNHISTKKTIPKKYVPQKYYYEFQDLQGQISTLKIENDVYDFENIKQPIVIVNIMATWCPPCRGQLPHLSKLQQKFKENVFVMSLLVHDDISNQKLKKLLIAQKVLFYVSNTQKQNLAFADMLSPKLSLSKDFPMPLSIVFVQGKYFTHYEGMIPEEMIESDIKLLLKKIKK